MSQRMNSDKRLIAVRYLTLAAFVVAIGSQARVHILGRGDILAKARDSKRFVVKTSEMARRGAIYTSDGRPLAQEDDSRVLVVDFRKVPRVSGFYMALGAATGIPASEFASLSRGQKKVVEWQKPFSITQANSIQDVKRKWQADGVGLRPAGNRSYSLSLAAANIIGTVQKGSAKLGIEQAFNRGLTGENGETVGMVDRYGQYLPMRMGRETKAKQDGTPITLTIDSELQRIAYEAVTQAVKARKADQGTVVIMVPSTGDILACASYPSFDPSKPFAKAKKGEFAPGHSTAFMSSLEPGSTFKILTIAKAIDDGVVGAYENFNCPGSMKIGNRTIHCASHGGSSAHGTLDPEQAIARSCNVVSAQWALRIGRTPFMKYIEDLGLIGGSRLGLPGEAGGLLDKNDPAERLQLSNLGFGQSLNVTPVALASAFCMIGNNGVAVHPRLIDRIGDNKQAIVPGKQVLKPETTTSVLQFMRSVMDSDRGTGHSLRIAGYDLGGKTGTAQRIGTGGYVSNFVGFVPADKPKAVILVMIDNPKGKVYYGAQVAGPVFLKVCKSVINRMAIPRISNLASKATPTRVAINSPRAQSNPVSPTSKPSEIEEVQSPPDEQVVASTGPEIEVSAREIPDREKSVIGRMTMEQVRKLAKPDVKRIAGLADETANVKTTGDVKRRKEPEPKQKLDKRSQPEPRSATEIESGKATRDVKRRKEPETKPREERRSQSTPTKGAAKTSSANRSTTNPAAIVRKTTRKSEPIAVVTTESKRAQPIAKPKSSTKEPKRTTARVVRRTEPEPKATPAKPRPKPVDRLKELELENARLRKLLESRQATKNQTAAKKPTSVTSKPTTVAAKKVVAKKSETPRKSSTSKPSSKKRT